MTIDPYNIAIEFMFGTKLGLLFYVLMISAFKASSVDSLKFVLDDTSVF